MVRLVHHQRAFSTLTAQHVEVELVLQTRNREHVDEVLARLAAAGVFLTGALSSSLAWLALCAEDAPDLIAAAPLRPGVAIRAKLAAALTPPALMVSVLALVVLPKSPVAVAVMLPMALVAGLASAAELTETFSKPVATIREA
jgi:hypothetical protein